MLRRVVGLTAIAFLLPVVGLAAQAASSQAPPVLEVTGLDYAFQAPDSIPAGWITVQFDNRGAETHVVEFARLPDGISYRDYDKQLAFADSVEKQLAAGTIDSAQAEKIYDRRLPDWFSSVQYSGGPGFLAPGETSRTTLRLEPGVYDVVCFIKSSDGIPHWALEMHRKLTVTPDPSDASPPAPDVELTLADYEITTDGRFQAGEQTIAVHFGSRPQSMEPPIQDVHLVRLPEETSVEEVEAWMTEHQAPAPATFLGGAVGMAPGHTVYLTVDLEPGRYAWVSQASEAKGMTTTFTVE